MNPEFWRGKRVFLTGHTGFKGGWLSLWLQSMGADVTGYSLDAPTQPSIFHEANVADGMRSIIGDIRNADELSKAIKTAEPEIVIHMAAQSLVRLSYADPVSTYAVNVMGTVNLFEAVRTSDSVKAVINITSDKCYENREWVWGYRENEPMGGYDPYSSSKGCAELVTSSYRNSFFNPENFNQHKVSLASARAGNVIGGGDWALDRLIPDMIRAFSEGKPVVIRSPYAIRPWQHVLEPLSGYLLLAEKMINDGTSYSEGWNFGPSDSDAKTVEWIVEQLVERWGDGASWQLDDKPQPHEARFLKLDCSKAHSLLNWKPRWGLGQALLSIVDWHKAHLDGVNMHEFTLKQIDEYMNA